MTNQYATRRLHSLVHYDPRCQPVGLTATQIDDDFIDDLFDDMRNKISKMQDEIYEMKELQRQIAKEYVAMA